MNDPPYPLTRHWIHSFEEDSGDIQTYRPEGYNFPRARGRAGIEFLADRRMKDWRSGAADAPEAVEGRWEYMGSGQIRVSGASQPPYTLEIVECDQNILRLRRRG